MKKRIVLVLVLCFLMISTVFAHEDSSENVRTSQSQVYFRPEMRISEATDPEVNRGYPQVAYNSNQHEFLVIWDNYWSADFRDIYARRISNTGGLDAKFTIATGADNDELIRWHGSLTFNATNGEYLVVYMVDALDDQKHWEIWGRRVAWDGHWNGPEFKIFSWPNRGFWSPHVAWNSDRNEYLVVANALDTQTGKWNDVAGRVVQANGTMPNFHFAISSQDQALQPNDADVVYNPVAIEYLVVWDRLRKGDIYGARVGGNTGTVVNPPGEFAIDDTNHSQNDQKVAVNSRGHYLVVSELNDIDFGDVIYGRELDETGRLIGSHISITDSGADYDPNVAARPATNAFLIVWNDWNEVDDGGIGGALWESSKDVNPGIPFMVTQLGIWPASAAGQSEYLVVYNKWVDKSNKIYGRMSWQGVNFLPLILR